MDYLVSGLLSITWQQWVMYVVGAVLIYLAIKKEFEPSLLLPMGFGAILVNLPSSGVLNQTMAGIGETNGIIEWLFQIGIEASEALPIILFIGIGAMIDFGPLLAQPVLFLFGAAAQFGIFFAICIAALMGFDLRDAASIGIIGAADGPTSILVSQIFGSKYVGAIAVAAYSYMALVPIIQPFAIRLVTTKKERCIKMPYNPKSVSRTTRILFPIIVTFIAGLVAPMSVWKPDPGVWSITESFRNGTEPACKPHYPAAWNYNFLQYAGRAVRQCKYHYDHGHRTCSVYL